MGVKRSRYLLERSECMGCGLFCGENIAHCRSEALDTEQAVQDSQALLCWLSNKDLE
jgi:hypothetical protein